MNTNVATARIARAQNVLSLGSPLAAAVVAMVGTVAQNTPTVGPPGGILHPAASAPELSQICYCCLAAQRAAVKERRRIGLAAMGIEESPELERTLVRLAHGALRRAILRADDEPIDEDIAGYWVDALAIDIPRGAIWLGRRGHMVSAMNALWPEACGMWKMRAERVHHLACALWGSP